MDIARHKALVALLFLFPLAFPSLVFGQSATVSVVDTSTQTSSTVYVNDPFTLSLTGPANSAITYSQSGVAQPPTGWYTNASGTFSIGLTVPSTPASYSQVWKVGSVTATPNPLLFTVAAIPTPTVSIVDNATNNHSTLTIGDSFTFALTGGKPNTAVTYIQGGTQHTPPYPAKTDSNGYYSFTSTVPSPPMTYSQVWNVGGANATPNPIVFTAVQPPPPNITSISPSSGAAGTSVTINGSNFGTSQGTSTVTFNGTTATASSWGATRIVAAVPVGATTGIILVTVFGVQSNTTFSFQVPLPPPNITGVSPSSGVVGSSVTITGTGFGAAQGGSTVMLGTTPMPVTTWSTTSIVAKVPTGVSPGSKFIQITVGGQGSNQSAFTVTPQISSLSLTSGPVQMGFVISGSNFGATQNTSTVTLNGTPLTVIANKWSDTSITVQIPPGASSGNVVVTVNGAANLGGNIYSFIITTPFGCVV